ncbi:hypothetical protein HaLaN_21960 [Haematococcus lacustris]|uniref:Uncharacterized protein n=1 Tax=Haematococcus lacustris TaxID=44745 RepID=A0A6A0A3A6_HAELA|nr:hypothetical protein HaLaN_21960 [Haematococcus lacustris]
MSEALHLSYYAPSGRLAALAVVPRGPDACTVLCMCVDMSEEAGQTPADTRSPSRCEIRPKHMPHMPTRRPQSPTCAAGGGRYKGHAAAARQTPPSPPHHSSCTCTCPSW